MAITYNNIAGDRTTGTAMVFTLTSAANTALLVAGFNDANMGITSIKYNDVALTKIANTTSEGELWVLANVAGGGILVISAVMNGVANWVMSGITYTGVSEADPTSNNHVSGSATGTNVNLSFSCATNDIAVNFWNLRSNSGITIGAGATARGVATGTASANMCVACSEIAGAGGATSLSVSCAASTKWIWVGCSLHISVAAATGVFGLCLQGCGF